MCQHMAIAHKIVSTFVYVRITFRNKLKIAGPYTKIKKYSQDTCVSLIVSLKLISPMSSKADRILSQLITVLDATQ